MIAEEKQSLLVYVACTFLSWCSESCVQGFFFFFADARCVCIPSLALPSPPSGSCMGAGSQSERQGSRNRSTAVSLCCPEKCSLVWVGASAARGRVGGRGRNPGAPLHAGFTWGLLLVRRLTPELWGLGGDKLILNLNQISACLSHAKTNDTLLDKLYPQTG